jgi:tRNA1(Val) A37 N6-methylase TrmN6
LSELSGLLEGAFGAVTVQPVHPKPDVPAIRVLARATKGSRAPFWLLPGLVLNDSDGRPTQEAEAVLRGAEALPLAAT